MLSKNQIISVMIFYSRFFPPIRGDTPSRQETAEKMASEMLRYQNHSLWKEVNRLHEFMPNNKLTKQ